MNERKARAFEEVWESTRDLWEELCPDVDTVLEGFAQRHHATIQRWKNDTASRYLTWHEDGASYGLDAVLNLDDEPRFELAILAWRDVWNALRRRTLRIAPEVLATPVDSSTLAARLERLEQRLSLVQGALEPGREQAYAEYKRLFDWYITVSPLRPRPAQ